MGSGIGNLDDVYETTVAFEKGVKLPLDSKKSSLDVTNNSRAIEKSPLSSSLVS